MRVRPAAEGHIRSGHPWVFDGSIREQNRPGRTGEMAVIFDRNDRFLAIGLFDAESPIRVRVIHRGKPVTIDREWWRERMRASIERRASVFDANTNAGRCVNGESDGFPGLVLDRYAGTLVLKLYSSIWFERLKEIVELISEEFAPAALVLRLSRNIRAPGLLDGAALLGEAPAEPVQFLESGLKFEADVIRGQKTGFFLDQRENRRRVEALARERHVLNAFSFSGGFSLYAARGGAKSVTDVDISQHALESARRNFGLNPKAAAGCEHRLVQADVFEWLRGRQSKAFDLVVLDPPSLAKRENDRTAALKGYGTLADAGFRLTRPGGVTVCCSCSGHVRTTEFFEAVTRTARSTGRRFEILAETREPQDHHAAFAEAHYLKAIYLRFLT